MLQLAVRSLPVGEVSYQIVCCKFVENPRVKDPDGDVVDPNIGTVKYEETVVHDSEAYICF